MPVDGLRDQAVTQQPGERSVALRSIRPHQPDFGTRHGNVARPQLGQDFAAHLPVGALELFLHRAPNTLKCGIPGSTPRALATNAVKMLKACHVTLTGCVVTRVDLDKQLTYSHGEYGYYHGKYKGYYSE